MIYTVTIWDKELKCEICSNNQWSERTLKTEFESKDNAWEYSEEVRYMFECKKCGNCKIFGMVSNEVDDVNIIVSPISEI